MFRSKDESYYEEGNGYRINDVPSDVNYNTCNVKYTLNNDFSKNPQAQFKDSTNIHSKKRHTDVNASNNMSQPSGRRCSRPMDRERPSSGVNSSATIRNQKPNGMYQGTGSKIHMNTQRTISKDGHKTKKFSPLGLLALPIVLLIVIFSIATGEPPTILIFILFVIAAVSKSKKNNNSHK